VPTAKREETKKRRSEEEFLTSRFQVSALFTETRSRADGFSSKSRRLEALEESLRNPAGAQCASRAEKPASVAAGLPAGHQRARESQIQTARDRVLLVSVILELADARSAWRRTRTAASILRFFVPSTLTVCPLQRDCERRGLGQPEQPHGVLFQNQRPYFIANRNLLEIREPSIRRDPRIVGSEQDFVLEHRVRILNQRRREILR
jgi:uncharacterized protein YfiM (DUF2279 family)